jgi:hypothetical protein
MTTIQSTHPSGERIPRRREHPEGTLAVAVVVGTIGLLWFAFYLWSVLGSDPVLWW